MNSFWRNNPLETDEVALLSAVLDAHWHSTFRSNPSTVAVSCAAQGSGDLLKSFTAGLSALGGAHGPILETFDWIQRACSFPAVAVREFFDANPHGKIPGWGSSFSKDGVDPIWGPVASIMAEKFNYRWRCLDQTTKSLHERGKLVYPNPSAFTAATAIIVGMPRELAPMILVMGRFPAWAELFWNEIKKG